jgi:hypothetical protein
MGLVRLITTDALRLPPVAQFAALPPLGHWQMATRLRSKHACLQLQTCYTVTAALCAIMFAIGRKLQAYYIQSLCYIRRAQRRHVYADLQTKPRAEN